MGGLSTWSGYAGAPGESRSRRGDLATMIGAMSKVIAMSDGDDEVWRRHLGFALVGLRA